MLKIIHKLIGNRAQSRYHSVFVAVFAIMLAVILFQCFFVYYEFQDVLYENFFYFANNSLSKAMIETETISRELTNISVQISNDYQVNSFWYVNQNTDSQASDFLKKYNYINYVENIYLYNEKNNQIYSDALPGYRKNMEDIQNSDIIDILQTEEEHTKQSRFYFYPSLNYYYAKNAYFVWYPFINSDNAIIFHLNFSVFENAFNDILLLENSMFWIVDDSGKLTYGNISPSDEDLNLLYTQAKSGKPYGFNDFDGKKEMFISSYSESLEQYFILKIPQENMLHTENFEKRVKFLIVLIIVFFAVVVLSAVSIRIFGREITHFKKSVKRMYSDMVQKKEIKWEPQARVLFTDSARCNLGLLRELGLSFDFENPICLALVNISGSKDILKNNEERELYKYGVINITCECVGECFPIFGVRMDDNEIAFLISAAGASPDEILELFESASGHIKKHLQLDFMVLISRIIDNYYEIDQEYFKLKRLTTYRYIFGRNVKCTAQALENRVCAEEEKIQADLKQLDKKFRAGQLEQAKELIEEIKKDIASLPISKVKTYVMLLTNILCDIQRFVGGTDKEDTEEYSVIAGAMSAETLSDAWSICDGVFEEICRYFTLNNLNKHEAVGKKIVELIDNYYNNPDLGLTYIADAVNLSSNYASKIFKDYTKMTIPNYILNVRLKKVSELLENTDMSLDEMAEKTGFGSTRYLYYVFKKQFQMTPVQYRRTKRMETKGDEQDE